MKYLHHHGCFKPQIMDLDRTLLIILKVYILTYVDSL